MLFDERYSIDEEDFLNLTERLDKTKIKVEEKNSNYFYKSLKTNETLFAVDTAEEKFYLLKYPSPDEWKPPIKKLRIEDDSLIEKIFGLFKKEKK